MTQLAASIVVAVLFTLALVYSYHGDFRVATIDLLMCLVIELAALLAMLERLRK